MGLSFLLLSLLALATSGYAERLQLSGRLASPSPGIHRRTSILATQLSDSQNVVYLTNVTFNGSPFSITVDTGSSDLWVSHTIPGAVPQNYQAEVSYASGSASGDVMSATFDFAGFSIESQFFIQALNADASGSGLIGLGPSSMSTVRALAPGGESAAANPPLDRIFTSNSSLSPMIAVLLQRSDDPDEPYPGDLTIGEVLPDYQNILNQPRHPVTNTPLQGSQHWQTLLDVNGIIGPNGQPIQIKTQVTGAQTPNATVVFDTGFTFPQVPSSVAQALYGDVPGASLENVTNIGEIWVIPCDQYVNATFLFGGVEFPIHPLDLNFDGLELRENGQSVCVGAFQPYSFNIVEENDIIFDMILGMAFLRNAYMLINFGNLVNAATPSTDTAYIQLLPLTNATQAAQDFASLRGGTGNNTHTLTSSNHKSNTTRRSPAAWLIALIACAAIVLLLLVAAVVFCCRRRRRRLQNAPPPGTGWVVDPQNYQRIHEPSPQAAYDMHMGLGTAPLPGYTPAYVPEYKTAWDAHY